MLLRFLKVDTDKSFQFWQNIFVGRKRRQIQNTYAWQPFVISHRIFHKRYNLVIFYIEYCILYIVPIERFILK